MSRSDLPDLICTTCGDTHPVASLLWRCPCGGLFDVAGPPARLIPTAAQLARNSLWRYESVLPVALDERISLGEGQTPVVRSRALPNVRFKLDFLMPTLSFKDRGAVVLATLAARLGVPAAFTDSSGNAGTAAAAYLARAGVACRVFVPATTAPAKLAQMRAHGAQIVAVPGSRADTATAARQAAGEPGAFYASHVFHPYFVHGVKTYGYEIWEQCGGNLPDVVVVPVGNGTLALGCHLAFTELHQAGLTDRVPALLGVRVADPSATVADGIAIADPPRGRQIEAAVQDTGGRLVTVENAEIVAARAELAAEGLFVEPTSAVCWAAVRRSPDLAGAELVLPLCGAGLKSPG